jgi:hypothetical protein
MNHAAKLAIALLGTVFGGSACLGETLQTHRIPAALAAEAPRSTATAAPSASITTAVSR